MTERVRVTKNAAAKKPRKLPKPKSGPAVTTILHDDLKAYQKQYGTDLVQILSATKIIVWNSVEQRRRLQGKVK